MLCLRIVSEVPAFVATISRMTSMSHSCARGVTYACDANAAALEGRYSADTPAAACMQACMNAPEDDCSDLGYQ